MQARDPRTPWIDAAEELGHVLQAQRGDTKAFLTLVRHYHRSTYRLAHALTRDVRAAFAVTQEALLKAHEGVRYMGEGRRFISWVASIVCNLARSRRPGASMTPDDALLVDPAAIEMAERYLAALDRLEPNEQAALALRIAEGLSYSQIESVLRLTPGSALPLLAGARVRLMMSEEDVAA